MAVLPLPPPDLPSSLTLDDFRDSQATAFDIAPQEDRAQLVADLATRASRLESMLSAIFASFDDMSTGRTSDLPRKSQRVMDLLQIGREEAKETLALAYQLLSEVQRG